MNRHNLITAISIPLHLFFLAAIPEYRVRTTADVYVPDRKTEPLKLEARVNRSVFSSGEKAKITVGAARASRIAVFNVQADDKVALLFPNREERNNRKFSEIADGTEDVVLPYEVHAQKQ